MTQTARKIGDYYSADPTDLQALRKLSKRVKESKSELIRVAIREFLNKKGRRF